MPFVGKDTPSRVRVSSPDVVISLTILAYRYEWLREADFLGVMQMLKQSMAAQYGAYHKREARRRFVAWVEGARARARTQRRIMAAPVSVEMRTNGSGRRSRVEGGARAAAAAAATEAWRWRRWRCTDRPRRRSR